MRTTNIIMLASLNNGKVSEYRELFKAYPNLKLKELSDLVFNSRALRDVEKANTYYENAFSKGKLGHLAAKVPTISDDSGLEVDALGGKPGVFSDKFGTINPNDPTDSQSKANIRKLLEELKGVPKEKRTARFTCTLLFFIEGLVLQTTGTLEGSILEVPRGDNGFGYDPVFLVKGSDKSLAEFSMEEKNKTSHRAKAFHAMIELIKQKDVKLVRP